MLTLNKTYNEPLILQLPTTFCEESLCAYLIIQTKPRKQLKIDVTKFSYKGKNDYFCKYGGLAVVEINEQIQERPAICEDDQRNTTKDKIFYSHKSSVILILYWYVGLSSIEGKVTVTESECRATQINICEMYYQCMYLIPVCVHYLQGVSWISGIIFRVVRPLHKRVKLRIAWVVGSNTRCFILNFFSDFLKHYGWPSSHCEVEFVATSLGIKDINFEVRHTIHGLIQNSTLEKYHGDLAPCRYACSHDQYHRTDVVEVRGHLEEFCRSFTTKENMSCSTRAYDTVFSSHEYVENEFVVNTKAYSLYAESYSIILRMYRFQQSWVTMITHITFLSFYTEYKVQVKLDYFFIN